MRWRLVFCVGALNVLFANAIASQTGALAISSKISEQVHADTGPTCSDLEQQLGIASSESPSPNQKAICDAAAGWNDPIKLYRVLRDIDTPKVVELIARRCTDLERDFSPCWSKLSLVQLQMNESSEARVSANNAVRSARDMDALGAAWLSVASVEDVAGNDEAYGEAMRAALTALPQLAAKISAERDQSISRYWPRPVSSELKSGAYSDHPSTQDRVRAMNSLTQGPK